MTWGLGGVQQGYRLSFSAAVPTSSGTFPSHMAEYCSRLQPARSGSEIACEARSPEVPVAV
jgi:hypothetical protein